VGILAFATVFVWSTVFARAENDALVVAFLDVGQGDAIYIETPRGKQILVDGGKDRAVLEELSRFMAFNDRSIDVVMATHPDFDHIGGLPHVFKRFDVGMFLEPGTSDDGADYEALQQVVRDEGLVPVRAQRGMTLALGEGAMLDILSPSGNVYMLEANRGSIVARLRYGDTTFMLTGDAPTGIEEYLVGVYGTVLKSDVLKLGHHGSKTSTGDVWLAAVRPTYAVVSAGCDNRYGHPHDEVLERLEVFTVDVAYTCDSGAIVFTSDGTTVQRVR
jgi:competence protein ComEC